MPGSPSYMHKVREEKGKKDKAISILRAEKTQKKRFQKKNTIVKPFEP